MHETKRTVRPFLHYTDKKRHSPNKKKQVA